MLVIDVSKWQGNIDFKAVKNAGVKGVIVRAGYGTTKDAYFNKNMDGAIAAGLQVGVYWFMYGANNARAVANAKKCLELIAPYKDKITLKVWSDWEYDSDKKAAGQTVASRTEFVRLFNQTIQDAGYSAGTYLNIDYYRNHFDMNVIKKWDIWLADYAGECDYPCTMRQYTSKGAVNGIKGNVDMNTYFGKPTQTVYTEVKTVSIKLTVLRQGAKSEEVKTVQRILKDMGYKGKNGKVLTIDGDYGANTAYAVSNFQKNEGLVADMIIGAKTWEHLLK